MATELVCVHIALDEWFARLFSPDRPDGDFVRWYVERKDRLVELIWLHTLSLLTTGSDVVLELGLIQRELRLAFYERMRDSGIDFVVHVLDAPLEERRRRVRLRNEQRGATFSMVVPDHVFDLASKLWEPPDELECEQYPVQLVAS